MKYVNIQYKVEVTRKNYKLLINKWLNYRLIALSCSDYIMNTSRFILQTSFFLFIFIYVNVFYYTMYSNFTDSQGKGRPGVLNGADIARECRDSWQRKVLDWEGVRSSGEYRWTPLGEVKWSRKSRQDEDCKKTAGMF